MVYAMLSIGVLGFIVWAWVRVHNFAICWNRLIKSIENIISFRFKIDGIFGKFDLLSNQQETDIKGSSETYTQSISNYNMDCKLTYPDHIKNYDKNFIEWFIGFSEGVGKFIISSKLKKISFIISQKDPKVLYYIRKTLGFGRVYKCKDTYYRYIVSDKKNLQHLINIFNQDRIILSTTLKNFQDWLEAYSNYYSGNTNPQIKINSYKNNISLKEAWLSGFIDAKANFSAYYNGKDYNVRFNLEQEEVLEQIKEIIIPNLLFQEQNRGADNYLETINELSFLIKYLQDFPLKSDKNIQYNHWLKLYRVIKDGGRGKSLEEIKTIAEKINKFEIEDKVQN